MTESYDDLAEAFIAAKAEWEDVREMHEECGMSLKFVGVQKSSDETWKVFFGVRYPDYMTAIADDEERAKEWYDMTPEKFSIKVESFWEDE